MSGVGYTDSNAPPPPATNYASISSHPQGQNGTRNGYASRESEQEHTPWPRFFRALGGAILVALLVGLLVESFYLATQRRAWDNVHLPEGYDVPDDISSVHHCAVGARWNDISPEDDFQGFLQQDETRYPTPGTPPRRSFPPMMYPFAANTSFEVPLSSTNDEEKSFLTIISRGRWLSGNVNIIGSVSQEHGKAKVEVVARHFRESTRDQLRACIVEGYGGRKGVGIFTPEYEWFWRGDSRRRQVYFEVNVHIPMDAEGTTFIETLKVDVPNASVQIETGVSGQISFNELTVVGRNGHIHAASRLHAQRVWIYGNNSMVSGSFVVTEDIHVETANGSVWTQVWAKHAAGRRYGPSIYLETSNGALESDIQLIPYSTLPTNPPGVPEYGVAPHYDIRAMTSNGRLNVNVASRFVGDKIPEPTIFLNATNLNGLSSASLYHTYSGDYDIQTHDRGAAQLNLRCTKLLPILCSDGVTRDHPEITAKGRLKGQLEWVPALEMPGPRPRGEAREDKSGEETTSGVVLKTWNGNAILSV